MINTPLDYFSATHLSSGLLHSWQLNYKLIKILSHRRISRAVFSHNYAGQQRQLYQQESFLTHFNKTDWYHTLRNVLRLTESDKSSFLLSLFYNINNSYVANIFKITRNLNFVKMMLKSNVSEVWGFFLHMFDLKSLKSGWYKCLLVRSQNCKIFIKIFQYYSTQIEKSYMI